MNLNKLYNLPIIKQIYEHIESRQFNKDLQSYKEDYISEYETQDLLFIWGILSYDNISSSKPNLYTTNDLELVYHKDTSNYSLSVETIYIFYNNSAQYGYMQSLLDEFTSWMIENNYDTAREFSLDKVFTKGISINTKFNSIEEAYAAFKMMVNGFCSMQNNKSPM